MPISISEATQIILAGKALSWNKFGNHKGGSIQLSSPGARRLFQFLLSRDQAKVAEAKEDLFDGLIAAWQKTPDDPATMAVTAAAVADAGAWRLMRLESAGFGGLNVVDGPHFVLSVEGENWCLEGQNGSGKTSIASAIIWALTGSRCRDQDGVLADDGQRVPVFNDSGVHIGDWPPTVAFPASQLKLGGPAEAWVRLTFQNQNGDIAVAFRRLDSPVSGEPSFEVRIDPVLLSAPQLVETGLLMPARLARIGFGDKSQTIYDAVKLLTGLDRLSDIGEGAANFSHGARRFLKYGADNGLPTIQTRLDLLLKRAGEDAVKAGFSLKITGKREDNDYAQELRKIADSASAQAGTHLSVLKSDVAPGLDTAKPEDRAKIKTAVSTARGILQQNVKGITVFEAWGALKNAPLDSGFQKLPATLADVRVKLAEALAWDKRQAEDAKLRLKALAAQFFVEAGHAHEAADCPLCESKLSNEKQKALAVELAELKKASEAAERKLSDACATLEKRVRDLLPQTLVAHFSLLAAMQPRQSFETAATERFVQEPPFSMVLTGMAAFAAATCTAISGKLPTFDHIDKAPPAAMPVVAQNLVAYVSKVERLIALAEWWTANRQHFVDGWNTLKGVADANGRFPADSLEGKLVALEAGLEKAAPLDEVAKALKDAAGDAEKWLTIHKGQIVRNDIASALEPLKELRTLVAAETASSISALSGRMKSVLDRIHFKERLSFEDAALHKKSVQVTGSFDHGIRIDASRVANSSWLRAILWAFVLAMREQTLETLGANPFPLVVLDDPQVTFDPRNKRKWAEEIARIANEDVASPEAMQLMVITHERHFFQLLVNTHQLTGQQGMVIQINKNTNRVTVVNGSSLSHSYQAAIDENDDAKGQAYVSDVRIYCEDLLKIMLRCVDDDVAKKDLSGLVPLLEQVIKDAVPPFNLRPFQNLLNVFKGHKGGKSFELLNSSHHVKDGSIGVAQAKDIKKFWEEALQSKIHTCFKVYAEYEAYSGEPRLFPWMDSVVTFPAGNSADIKKLTLVQTGIAAAAKSDGRAGDGLITIEELQQSTKVTLHNHDVYQLAAGTLDPVATIGDAIIVKNYGAVHARNLVVTAFGDQLLARRYNETELHPHIAVLTGQSVDPYALVQPVIVPHEKIASRKIVGTLFTATKLPTPPKDENVEFAPLIDLSVVNALLDNSRLFKVNGRSAEPIALNDQFLITRDATMTAGILNTMDGRLVIAVDEFGTRYFKRLRLHGQIMVLESLNPDGTSPGEVLTLGGELGLPRLTGLLEVVGVLFELPG